jgi:hypothetical protein
MNQDQKQKPFPVQTSENRRASDQITQARERFKELHGIYPSVIQVGEELFRRAYPHVSYPHRAEAIAGTLIVPREDICGKWAIVIPKPPELRRESVA